MFTIQTERGRFKVEFRHQRNDIGKDGKLRESWRRGDPAECRGYTTCTISKEPPLAVKADDGVEVDEIVSEGDAACHRNDNWSYAAGRKLALARALWKAIEKRWLRRIFWDCYHIMSNRVETVDPYLGWEDPANRDVRVDDAVDALAKGLTILPAATKVGSPLRMWIWNHHRKVYATAVASQAAAPEPPQQPSPPQSETSSG